MKKPKVIHPIIKTIKPLFWKNCRFCGNSFKWEQGYEIEDYTMVNAHLFWSYCCNKCANSEKKVKILVAKDKIILSRPELFKAPKGGTGEVKVKLK